MTDLWIDALSAYSTTRESVLEHRFLADVASCLWKRGEFAFAISHSEVDNSGYDVILEACGITRHVQLKAMHVEGTADSFKIQQRLEEKPSSCVVLIVHDARTLAIDHYRWFGGAPGEKMPSLGDKIAVHTKGNSDGFKAQRPAIRELAKSRFAKLADIDALVDHLFGTDHP
ncbi:MAG: hypothetical protein A2885_16995 [Sphingopyxis sp. RIFCSPHIGHO2_01_FULL_65_24]|nr:MAG: hypothetical protein A2885_16995 [Sphingopyxis sp. RIFCSPHIGHO2_01_FULL_65_24]